MPQGTRNPPGPLYGRLPPGAHGLDRAEVRRHQRDRLYGAMIAAVGRSGYAKTTVAMVVGLAGVSRSTFYEHFTDREDCFLRTYETIMALGTQRVAQAYRSAEGLRARLRAAFAAFIEIVTSDPGAARLVIIDALAAGAVALEHREQAVQAFERLLAQSFAQAGLQKNITDVTLRGIVGGVQRIVYIHLREGRTEQLRDLVDELVDWTLSHVEADVRPPAAPRTPKSSRPSGPSPPQPKAGAEGSSESGHRPGQRERVLSAVLGLVTETGYPALTVPGITARAGISNQTFYEQFTGKEEAFLAAFDQSTAEALEACAAAFHRAPSLPEGVREAIRALLAFTASHPGFARLGYFEPLAPGTVAEEHAEQALQGFVDLLSPGPYRPPGLPSIAEQATAGAVHAVLQREIAYDRLTKLPRLTPSMAYLVLAPYLGAESAARIAMAPSK
jgi:AcrR family transcriptional regulator